MLFQSHTGVLDILPALPSVWKNGSIRGLKGVGDFTVDIKWKNGKATFVRIINNQGQPCKVKYNDFETLSNAKVYLNGKATAVSNEQGSNIISVESKAGDEIIFDISGEYITAVEDVVVEKVNQENWENDFLKFANVLPSDYNSDFNKANLAHNLHIIERLKYVRYSFFQSIIDSETHWLDRPIIPNQIDKEIWELF